jgi:nitroreductase
MHNSGRKGDAIDLVLSRVSAVKLREPGPSAEHLDLILTAGARAPDHGRLRPWRFVVVRDGARERLGGLFACSLKARDPSATEPLLQKEREKASRAPLIIVAAAAVQYSHPKIPPIEQIVAVGAAVQNMILVAGALGYGTFWRTGPAASDPLVKEGLGFSARDEIVSFLYIGAPDIQGPQRKVEFKDLVREL